MTWLEHLAEAAVDDPARNLANARRLSRAMRVAAMELRAEVDAARAAGASWAAIAEAVGESPFRPFGSSATAMQRFYGGGS